MKVRITKEHCLKSSGYGSAINCPLCVAIKEQHPESGLFHAGGDYIRDRGGDVRVFFNAAPKDGWNCSRVDELEAGIISEFILELPYPEYDNRQTYQDITTQLAVLPISETSDVKTLQLIGGDVSK